MSRWIAPVLAVAGTLAAPFASGIAAAQTYPDRSVRLVVPFGAGGVSDIVGRTLAARM